jgi:hypothetical protein
LVPSARSTQDASNAGGHRLVAFLKCFMGQVQQSAVLRVFYEIALIGLDSKPIKSESGIVFRPNYTVRNSQN